MFESHNVRPMQVHRLREALLLLLDPEHNSVCQPPLIQLKHALRQQKQELTYLWYQQDSIKTSIKNDKHSIVEDKQVKTNAAGLAGPTDGRNVASLMQGQIHSDIAIDHQTIVDYHRYDAVGRSLVVQVSGGFWLRCWVARWICRLTSGNGRHRHFTEEMIS